MEWTYILYCVPQTKERNIEKQYLHHLYEKYLVDWNVYTSNDYSVYSFPRISHKADETFAWAMLFLGITYTEAIYLFDNGTSLKKKKY